MHAAGICSREDARNAVPGIPVPGWMPIRYDRVLARSLRQLARLRTASFPPPCARIWGPQPRLIPSMARGLMAKVSAYFACFVAKQAPGRGRGTSGFVRLACCRRWEQGIPSISLGAAKDWDHEIHKAHETGILPHPSLAREKPRVLVPPVACGFPHAQVLRINLNGYGRVPSRARHGMTCLPAPWAMWPWHPASEPCKRLEAASTFTRPPWKVAAASCRWLQSSPGRLGPAMVPPGKRSRRPSGPGHLGLIQWVMSTLHPKGPTCPDLVAFRLP